MQLNTFIVDFFTQLSESKVRYCVLRNYEKLPEENIGSDIDLLVPPTERRRVLQILSGMPECKIVSISPRSYVIGVFIQGVQCGDSQRAIQIDIVTSLAWKGISYLSTQSVLDQSEAHTTHPLINKPAPHHEAVISLFSSYLVGGWIKDRYQSRVREIFGSHSQELFALLSPVFGQSATRKLINYSASDERDCLIKILPMLKLRLILHSIKRNIATTVASVTNHYLAEIKMRYTPKFVVQMCILGMDGAGKSTAISELAKELNGSVKEIEVIHLKPSLLRRRNMPSRAITDPHGKPARNDFITFLKLSTWVVQYHLKRFFHGHKACTLIIWDRYIYDVLIDPLRYRSSLSKGVLNFLIKASPKVDGLVVLDLPALQAYRRKQEVPLQSLENIRNGYLEFAAHTQNAAIVNTSCSLDVSVLELKKFTISVLASHAQDSLDRIQNIA